MAEDFDINKRDAAIKKAIDGGYKASPQAPAPASDSIRSPIRSEPIRTRKRDNHTNIFHIDKADIPDGISREWKREAVFDKPDLSHQMALQENGWEVVQSAGSSKYMPSGYTGPVRRDGMILMERPIELTREAQAEDLAAAREEVRGMQRQNGQAPAGHGPRDHPEVRPRHGRDYVPLDIPLK